MISPRPLVALLLVGALLSPWLTACGDSDPPETSLPNDSVQTTEAPTPTTLVTTTQRIPVTASPTVPQTTPVVPVTTTAPVTTPEPDEPVTSPQSTTTTAKPVTTTTKSVTTTTKPITTTTKPITTTTVPVTTTAPVTTTVPVTAAPLLTPVPTCPDEGRETVNYDDLKAMWLSQYDLTYIYTENKVQRAQSDYTARINRLLDRLVQMGFNTVFLQVRPNGDSMYPSAYYPLSKYVSGAYGRDADYDPVEILVRAAHDRGLSVHAWINPLRCMDFTEITLISEEYPIGRWFNDPEKKGTYLVQSGTYWYLNPAYPEVRELIWKGAEELLSRYPFDGLHMDDYFYPTTDAAFDQAAYDAYLADGGTLSLADFRRDCLNQLVKGLYDLTKAQCDRLLYGISPAGNIVTVYQRQYADVYTWCQNEGYIDYLCPQIYYGLEHETLDFATGCKSFQTIITVDSVDLIIGLSFGKAMSGYDQWAGTGQNEWSEHKDVIRRCVEYTTTLTECRGVSVFCYQYFYDPVAETPVDATAEEVANFVDLLLTVSWKEE